MKRRAFHTVKQGIDSEQNHGLVTVKEFADIDANFSLIKQKLVTWMNRYSNASDIPHNTLRLFVNQIDSYRTILTKEEKKTRQRLETVRSLDDPEALHELQMILTKILVMKQTFDAYYTTYSYFLVKPDAISPSIYVDSITSLSSLMELDNAVVAMTYLIERYQQYQEHGKIYVTLDDTIELQSEKKSDFVYKQIAFIEDVVYQLDRIASIDERLANTKIGGRDVRELWQYSMNKEYICHSLAVQDTPFWSDATKVYNAFIGVRDKVGYIDKIYNATYDLSHEYPLIRGVHEMINDAIYTHSSLDEIYDEIHAILVNKGYAYLVEIIQFFDRIRSPVLQAYAIKNAGDADTVELVKGFVDIWDERESLHLGGVPPSHPDVEQIHEYLRYIYNVYNGMYTGVGEMIDEFANRSSLPDYDICVELRDAYNAWHRAIAYYDDILQMVTTTREAQSLWIEPSDTYPHFAQQALHTYWIRTIHPRIIDMSNMIQTLGSHVPAVDTARVDEMYAIIATIEVIHEKITHVVAAHRLTQNEIIGFSQHIQELQEVKRHIDAYRYGLFDTREVVIRRYMIESAVPGVTKALRHYIEDVYDRAYQRAHGYSGQPKRTSGGWHSGNMTGVLTENLFDIMGDIMRASAQSGQTRSGKRATGGWLSWPTNQTKWGGGFGGGWSMGGGGGFKRGGWGSSGGMTF